MKIQWEVSMKMVPNELKMNENLHTIRNEFDKYSGNFRNNLKIEKNRKNFE